MHNDLTQSALSKRFFSLTTCAEDQAFREFLREAAHAVAMIPDGDHWS